jgi:hypothetical protein
MKKVVLMIFVLASMFVIPLINAVPCELDVSMINQDPYPAIPGDYVKVVFQIDGLANSECGMVSFEIKENYPFSLDPNVTNKLSINAGTYSRSYSSFYLATYKLRVAEDALDGNNPMEVVYSNKNGAELLEEFDIYVQDTRADFEVNVKEYDYLTQEISFEILNIEDVDVQALTVEIPKQENIQIKGANRKVIGDLDSNEYTSADFEAVPKNGEITLKLIYTDSINVRREINKTVMFDSDYFSDRNGAQKKQPIWLYVIIVLVVGWFVWRQVRKSQKKKHLERRKNEHHHL